MMFDNLLGLLIVAGSLITLIGSIGLLRLPDFLMRLHGPSKASTLGVGLLLLASTLYFWRTDGPDLREGLILCFVWLTAPVSALLLAQAALKLKRRGTVIEPISTGQDQY